MPTLDSLGCVAFKDILIVTIRCAQSHRCYNRYQEEKSPNSSDVTAKCLWVVYLTQSSLFSRTETAKHALVFKRKETISTALVCVINAHFTNHGSNPLSLIPNKNEKQNSIDINCHFIDTMDQTLSIIILES